MESELENLHELMVQTAQVGMFEDAKRREHREGIMALTATPEDVEEWYFGTDPIEEANRLVMSAAVLTGEPKIAEGINQELLNTATMLAKGGTTLLTSAILPKAFQEHGNDWYRELRDAFPDFLIVDEAAQKFKGYEGVLDLCLAITQRHEISFEQHDIRRLFIAAEMLQDASRRYYQMMQDSGVVIADYPDERLEKLVFKLGGVSDSLFAYIRDYGLLAKDPVDDGEIEDTTKLVAAKAAVLDAAQVMDKPPVVLREGEQEYIDEVYVGLVSYVRQLFVDRASGLSTRLREPSIKGALHEVMWFLDAYTLRRMHPEKYGEIGVRPAYLNKDAPLIGKPELKRGVDYILQNRTATEYIQIKSRKQQKNQPEPQPYHPIIILLREQNFQEVDFRRLNAKLRLYEQWANGGFSEDRIPELTKYVMPTVVTAFEHSRQNDIDRTAVLHGQIMGKVVGPKVLEFVQSNPELFGKQTKQPVNPFVKPQGPYSRG